MGEPQPDPNDSERGNRDVWGDEPEEIDASAVVEELESSYPDTARQWHEHPAFVPFKAVGLFIRRSGRRVLITAVGFFLLIVAVVIIPVPGPWSILLTIVALSILATEYVWAERLLKMAKEKAELAKDKVLRRKPSSDDGSTA